MCAELRIGIFPTARLSADDRRIAVLNTAFELISGVFFRGKDCHRRSSSCSGSIGWSKVLQVQSAATFAEKKQLRAGRE